MRAVICGGAAVMMTAAPAALPGAVAAGASPAGQDGHLQITLAADGSTHARQGEAFHLTAYALNKSSSEVMATIKLRVHPVGGGRGVPFEDWMVMLPPGGFEQTHETVTSATWYGQQGPFQVDATMGKSVLASLPYTVDPPAVQSPTFADATMDAGIDTMLPMAMCSRFVSGAAWGDVNSDGALDLYVPNQEGPAQLWINDGHGHFTDQAAARGVDGGGTVGLGATFVDYNNDGAEDLYVANDGPNRLYMNDGTGHFTDVTAQAGVGGNATSSSASWGDFNGDGYVDLYVTNYTPCDGNQEQSAQDVLYRNNGDGTFTDVTSWLGPPKITEGAGFEAAWFDYNGDGRVDLYLANDHIGLSSPGNKLWRNDGPGQDGTWMFTDVSETSGANWIISDMGIGIGDTNNDGMQDMALSNMMGNYLGMNEPDGTFTNMAPEAGVDRPMQKAMAMAVTWGLGFADLNLDGWLDLYVNAGDMPMMMSRPGSGPAGSDGPGGGGMGGGMMMMDYQPNQLYANLGNGHFADLSAPSGANKSSPMIISRGLAFADYDRDGRMDIFVVNQESMSTLYRNTTPMGANHWLEVKAVGTTSNRDACGATVVATVGTMKLTREVFCGSVGLGSGSDTALHFGLGGASKVSSLVIMWPSGKRQVLNNVKANQYLTVVES